jgi:hypothetical protein
MLFGFCFSKTHAGKPLRFSPVAVLKLFWVPRARTGTEFGDHAGTGAYHCRCAVCAQTSPAPLASSRSQANTHKPRVFIFVFAACAVAPLLVASAAYAWMGRLSNKNAPASVSTTVAPLPPKSVLLPTRANAEGKASLQRTPAVEPTLPEAPSVIAADR